MARRPKPHEEELPFVQQSHYPALDAAGREDLIALARQRPVFDAHADSLQLALDLGRELKPAYLLSGFTRNTAALALLGALYLLGNLLTEFGHFDEAREHFERAIEIAPRRVFPLAALCSTKDQW